VATVYSCSRDHVKREVDLTSLMRCMDGMHHDALENLSYNGGAGEVEQGRWQYAKQPVSAPKMSPVTILSCILPPTRPIPSRVEIAAWPHLVHLSLLQEELEHNDQVAHGGQGAHQLSHQLGSLGTIRHVEADVKGQTRLHVVKLDDRNLGSGDDLHMVHNQFPDLHDL